MKTVYIDAKYTSLSGETSERFTLYLDDNEGKNEIKEYINAKRKVLSREDKDFQKLTIVAVHSVKNVCEYFSINSFE